VVEPTDPHALGVSDFGIGVSDDDEGAHSEVRADDPRYPVADLVRRINSLVVGSPISDEAFAAAQESLEEAVARLEAGAGSGRRKRIQPNRRNPAQDYFPTSPVIGLANPIAPPVEVEATADGLKGRAFFDYQYEGPPGCVHGGMLAMVFDEMLGAANIAVNSPGMTGTLTIRYNRPTPIRTELRLAARCEGRDGRKIRSWGGIYHGDQLTAEAHGIFIELVADRFMERIAKYGNLDLPT
jgi:acyl-coenzyme A thioesterase PaaI-like protein